MYLKRLEIQGFKSFAGKTRLEFLPPQNGFQSITAMVGPNGAGKSNITDALRWAMGETSLKSLRGKKSEDVIFGGSPARAALGVAEAAMVLANLDGSGRPERITLGPEWPLDDASEITITRRLYRSGEGEYLINQQPVRLLDIHLLLAKLQFAQHSYSLVGQGTIDRLLAVSPGERKDFFDEACGIKEHQLKQHQAELKLGRTRENMRAAEALLREVEPRLRLLSRQVKKLEKRQEVETELREVQEEYYAILAGQHQGEIGALEQQLAQVEERYRKVFSELSLEQIELGKLAQIQSRSEAFRGRQAEYQAAVRAKQALERELTLLEGQVHSQYRERGAEQISWLEHTVTETRARAGALQDKLAAAEAQARGAERRAADDARRLEALTQAAEKSSRGGARPGGQPGEAGNYLELTGGEAKAAVAEAKRRFGRIAEISATFNPGEERSVVQLWSAARPNPARAGETIHFSARLILPAATELEPSQLSAREEEQAINAARAAIAESRLLAQAKAQAAELLSEECQNLEREVTRLTRELSLAQALPEHYDAVVAKLAVEKERLTRELAARSAAVEKFSRRLEEFNEEEEAKKQRIFALQRELQTRQTALNAVLAEQNELKIALAKLETKQEDLERELEHELKTSLQSLRERVPISQKPGPALELSAQADKIEKLKYQLSLIGGIDAEVVEEHSQTKERHEFLTAQLADLTAATEDLETLVAELSELMKRQRAAAFKQIRKEFDRYFKILFEGGSADLEEVYGEVEAWEAEAGEAGAGGVRAEALPGAGKREKILTGIEVIAHPPGKRIKHLQALSGGERTLTSIALISAILHTNPAPFVVLDEVEAALDESNTVRFTRILKELATRSQFIIVTHNRVTMHAADALYGVVMGADGASKLLSVKLEEVERSLP